MKTTIWFAVFSLLLTACQPQQQDQKTIQIEPLSEKEIRAIRIHVQTGIPLEEALESEDACQSFADGLPADFIKGTVEVPEDYSKPEGRKIKVFYYGKLEAGKDPVVFYNGGPASDSHSSYAAISRVPDSQKHSWVYVDQRGTGCSDLFPAKPTSENVERLTHYTSTQIVKDSEAIREKLLGVKSQWKIFGQSYGGLIVHRYAIEAPQSVKGAFAHGFSLMSDQNDWLKHRISSQQRVLGIYLMEYPDDGAILSKARSLIQEDMCFEDTDGTKVCGPKVLDAMAILLGFSNTWPRLHNVIGKLVTAEGEIEAETLSQFVRTYVFGVYNNNGLAGSVISMTEISGGGSEMEACNLVNEKLEAEGKNPQAWLINECRLLSGMKNDKWTELLKDVQFKFGMTPAQLKASLEKNPKLPFFLYSGYKDVFVPVESFEEEVSVLGNLITYRQFENSGHEGFYTEPQVWSDLLSVH